MAFRRKMAWTICYSAMPPRDLLPVEVSRKRVVARNTLCRVSRQGTAYLNHDSTGSGNRYANLPVENPCKRDACVTIYETLTLDY
jgi:hypothetical protein